jgi:hypothetical protein
MKKNEERLYLNYGEFLGMHEHLNPLKRKSHETMKNFMRAKPMGFPTLGDRS